MKINLEKVLRVAGRLILSAPAIIEVVRPIVAKRGKPQTPAREQFPDQS